MTDVTDAGAAIARAALLARLRAAALAMLGAAVRAALIAAGSALVTRGWTDQATVDGYLPTAVEMTMGALLAAGGFAWGQARAYLVHTRWAAAWAALTGADRAPPAA